MATTGNNCYNNTWCGCLLYYNQGCSGDYSSLQYNGYDSNARSEYNCMYDSRSYKSYRCYVYKAKGAGEMAEWERAIVRGQFEDGRARGFKVGFLFVVRTRSVVEIQCTCFLARDQV
jgi:hypothetical protein